MSSIKKKCLLCPENDINCLDFHHLKNKRDGIAKMLRSSSLTKIKEEIEKCIVLCSNCHRKLHGGSIKLPSRKEITKMGGLAEAPAEETLLEPVPEATSEVLGTIPAAELEVEVAARETEHVLEFLNPVLLPGLNITVRNGKKWLKAFPGDTLQIKKTGENAVVATGKALCVLCLCDAEPGTSLVDNIPDMWLQYEHDPSCRTADGLKAAMDRAYGEGNWGTELSILMFMV